MSANNRLLVAAKIDQIEDMEINSNPGSIGCIVHEICEVLRLLNASKESQDV